jgi:hypothetical protein
MRTISFHEWLVREHRPEEVPDATTLALLIARAGAAGISGDDLRRLVPISSETLENLLAALMAAGQVVVSLRNGQRMYRAAM